MPTVEVSRTLVKSPPELWEELSGERLKDSIGAEEVKASEDERLLVWETDGARGTATLEPSGWGTKVILRAEVEETIARLEREDTFCLRRRRRAVLRAMLSEALSRQASEQRKRSFSPCFRALRRRWPPGMATRNTGAVTSGAGGGG